jgi:hypothetical protein
MYSFDTRYKETIGSPFLNDYWVLGDVVDKKKQVWKDVWMKYDAFADELMVKTAKGDSIVVKQSAIEGFTLPLTLANYTFKVMNLENFEIKNPNKTEGYFQILYDGKTKLYARHRISFIKAQESSAYAANTSNKFVKDVPILYLQLNDEKPLKLSKNKKSFLKVLKSKENELKSYIEKENLDFSKDSDILRLLSYYDSLLQ